MYLYDTTKVTAELRNLVDNGVDLWNFDYPSYYKGDEKKAFEQKVIDHYYLRQIGSETVGRFLHQFRTRVREIMPRYVELYKTVEIMHGLEDPFANVDIVETYEQEQTGSASTTSESTSTDSTSSETTSTGGVDRTDNRTITGEKERRFSDTPQGSIDNLDSYMSEATRENESTTDAGTLNETSTGTTTGETSGTGSATSSSEATNTGRTSHTLTRKGNQGVNTYAHDMIEFRQSIIDVDMMVIDDLNCLFLQIY